VIDVAITNCYPLAQTSGAEERTGLIRPRFELHNRLTHQKDFGGVVRAAIMGWLISV